MALYPHDTRRTNASATSCVGRRHHIRQRMREFLLLAAASASFVTCAPAEVDVTIAGDLAWGDCRSGAWEWSPSFAALNLLDDGSALLRFQSGTGGLDQDDYLTFLIRDYTALVSDGFPLEVEVVPASPDVLRAATATMALTASCPQVRDLPVEITGTLRLDEADRGRRGQVAGTFVVTVTSTEPPQQMVSTALNGSFRFDFRDDPPYSTLR